jgi:hypothetical protein
MEEYNKGIAPNLIIILAIGVTVLVALGAFFFSASFGGISEADAQRLFAVGCARYCQSDIYLTFSNAYTASRNDPQFVAACTRLGHGDQQHVNRCLESCGNCNLDISEGDVSQQLDTLNALTTRG